MATIEKRSGSYRVKVRVMGRSESETFQKKVDAVAWGSRRETELRSGGRSSRGVHTVADMIDRYAAIVAPTRRGARWELIRCGLIKRKVDFVGQHLSKVDASDWAAWRDARLAEVSGASVGRELNLISSMYEFAKSEWRWVVSNPIRDIKKPAGSNARTRVFLPNEVEAICSALGYAKGTTPETISQRVALALLVAIETAMRTGELCALRRSNLDLNTRVAHLPMTKNGDSRNVPLSVAAVELLKLAPGADRVFDLNQSQVDSLFRKAKTRAGIQDVHFHDSRATALTKMSRRVDVMTLAKISGHRDLNMLLNVYYRETASSIAARI